MAKQSSKPIRAKAPRRKRKTLTELNEWLTANHDALLKKARANSVALTGKPTFGGTTLSERRICHV